MKQSENLRHSLDVYSKAESDDKFIEVPVEAWDVTQELDNPENKIYEVQAETDLSLDGVPIQDKDLVYFDSEGKSKVIITSDDLSSALDNKVDKEDVVQESGQSETKVMSQKAVTDALALTKTFSPWQPEVAESAGIDLPNQMKDINIAALDAELVGSTVQRIGAEDFGSSNTAIHAGLMSNPLNLSGTTSLYFKVDGSPEFKRLLSLTGFANALEFWTIGVAASISDNVLTIESIGKFDVDETVLTEPITVPVTLETEYCISYDETTNSIHFYVDGNEVISHSFSAAINIDTVLVSAFGTMSTIYEGDLLELYTKTEILSNPIHPIAGLEPLIIGAGASAIDETKYPQNPEGKGYEIIGLAQPVQWDALGREVKNGDFIVFDNGGVPKEIGGGEADLSEYTQRTADETITGDWNFTGGISVGDAKFGVPFKPNFAPTAFPAAFSFNSTENVSVNLFDVYKGTYYLMATRTGTDYDDDDSPIDPVAMIIGAQSESGDVAGLSLVVSDSGELDTSLTINNNGISYSLGLDENGKGYLGGGYLGGGGPKKYLATEDFVTSYSENVSIFDYGSVEAYVNREVASGINFVSGVSNSGGVSLDASVVVSWDEMPNDSGALLGITSIVNSDSEFDVLNYANVYKDSQGKKQVVLSYFNDSLFYIIDDEEGKLFKIGNSNTKAKIGFTPVDDDDIASVKYVKDNTVAKVQEKVIVTANKTLTAADSGKLLIINADGITITMPASSDFNIDIAKMDESFITIVQSAGTDKFREGTATISVIRDVSITNSGIVGKEWLAIGAYEA